MQPTAGMAAIGDIAAWAVHICGQDKASLECGVDMRSRMTAACRSADSSATSLGNTCRAKPHAAHVLDQEAGALRQALQGSRSGVRHRSMVCESMHVEGTCSRCLWSCTKPETDV